MPYWKLFVDTLSIGDLLLTTSRSILENWVHCTIIWKKTQLFSGLAWRCSYHCFSLTIRWWLAIQKKMFPNIELVTSVSTVIGQVYHYC